MTTGHWGQFGKMSVSKGPWRASEGNILSRGKIIGTMRSDGGDLPAQENAKIAAAGLALYEACKVIALTPSIVNYLSTHDTMALEQLQRAITQAEIG